MKLIAPWGELCPENKDEFSIKSSFEESISITEFVQQSLILVNSENSLDLKKINEWLINTGRAVNIPIDIDLEGVILKYYLDWKGAKIGRHYAEMNIYPRKGNHHFFEMANGTTFELIGSTGVFAPYFVKTPYLIEKDNIVLDTIIIAITLYGLIMDSIRQVKEIAQQVAWFTDVNIGTGVLAAVINLLAITLYFIATVIQIIVLSLKLKELYFPKLRHLKAISDFDLVNISCNYLGFTFQSNFLNSYRQMHTLPVPVTEQTKPSFFQLTFNEIANLANDNYNKGYPTAQDTTPTLGSFFEFLHKTFNLETKVVNGVVRTETEQFWQSTATQIIPNNVQDESNREQYYYFNDNDIWKRKLVQWQVDYNDLHTVDNFDDNISEYEQSISAPSSDLVTIAGVFEIDIPFALGARKTKLNAIESLAYELFLNIDSIVNAFGGSSNLAGGVLNRVGVLKISEQTFSITKKLWLNSQNKQPSNFKSFLGAEAVSNFNLFKNSANYSFKIYENTPLQLSLQEYRQIEQNNFVILETGEVCKVLNIEYNDSKKEAICTYQIKDTSLQNVAVTKIY